MGFDDICNSGLFLALGLVGEEETVRQSPVPRLSSSFMVSNGGSEPSLMLGLSVESYRVGEASPHSVVSSLSSGRVKREGEFSSEDMEVEKVYSRVSEEDEEGSNSRKKLRLTKEQSALLEDSFKLYRTLNPKQKQGLARQLNLRPRQVEVWFQNRRARTKLKQTEVDCEMLKKCCETLVEENRKLQKEIEELKSSETRSPFLQANAGSHSFSLSFL